MRLVGSYQYIAYCVASHVVICNCITSEMNKFGIYSFLHADSDDSDQTGRMPRLI